MTIPTATKPIEASPPVVERNTPPSAAQGAAGEQHHYRGKQLLKWIVPVILLLAGALVVLPDLLQKWLWMRELNYAGIFWTLLSVKWGMTCIAFVTAFLFLWINIRQAARNAFGLAEDDAPKEVGSRENTHVIEIQGVTVSRRALTQSIAVFLAIVAAMFALGIYSQWDTYLRFRYGGSFGYSDPVFGLDVGFFLFSLPFYHLLQRSLAVLTALAILGVAFQYVYFEAVRLRNGRPFAGTGNAAPHLSVLFFILAATFGCGFYLDRFALLYSTMGVVHGVGYTADHVTMIALWVMIGISAVACATRTQFL